LFPGESAQQSAQQLGSRLVGGEEGLERELRERDVQRGPEDHRRADEIQDSGGADQPQRVIALNVAWVIASGVLLLSGQIHPNTLGYGFVIAQAIAVAAFAEMQYVGLRGKAA
jgi:hypothetical protein